MPAAKGKKTRQTKAQRVYKKSVTTRNNILFPIANKNKHLPKAALHADYLSLLSRTNNKSKRQKLIELASREQIDALAEITNNILLGTLVLTQEQLRRLRKYKNSMRLLVNRSTPLVRKRKTLQRGGLIGALLGPAIAAVSSLVSSLMHK